MEGLTVAIRKIQCFNIAIRSALNVKNPNNIPELISLMEDIDQDSNIPIIQFMAYELYTDYIVSKEKLHILIAREVD